MVVVKAKTVKEMKMGQRNWQFCGYVKTVVSCHHRIFCLILLAAIVLFMYIGCGGGGGGGEAVPLPPLSVHGKTYGGTGDDYAWSAQQTIDGGYIFAGSTTSAGAGGYDAWVVKTDASGNVALKKTFGTSGNDFAFSVQQTTDGGYIVAGVNNTSLVLYPGFFIPGDYEGELSLRKLDMSLNLTWETKMGPDDVYPISMAYTVQQTADSGYVVAGSAGYNLGGGYPLLLKIDAAGGILWNVLFPDGGLGSGVRQVADGGYIVSTLGLLTPNLIKTGSGGALVWESTLGLEWEHLHSVPCMSVWNTSDGGFAVTGGIDANSGDVLVTKTAADGTIIWEHTFGSPGGDIGYSIQQVSDNGYIVVGGGGSGGGPNHLGDVYLLKLDGAGNLIWERYFGGYGDDIGRSVRQTSDGGYILAGSTTSAGAGGVDAYLIKTDAAGVPAW